MKKYTIVYETKFGHEYINNQTIQFDAENELHAINMLINFYEQMEEKISCIEKISES